MRSDRDLIQPGMQFEDWAIQEQIGRGAYGKVYRATHSVIGRQVALKHVARPFDTAPEVFRRRVRREAQIAGRLRHPNVVTLYGAKELEDKSWLFEFEYVPGTDLAHLIRSQGALEREQTLGIVAELADAIQALHALGAVHNDIKPANVLISDDGVAKLADFGLGSLPSEESLVSSSELRPRGTPLYMPPEVILGHAGDTRSDLWSLGAVLHEMATGAPPFQGPHLPALFSAIHNAAPSEAPRDADIAAVGVARWCLSKRPADRPSSAGQVLQALRAEIELPQPSTGPNTPDAIRTALVGRDQELTALRKYMAAAFRAEAAYCFISGDAGVGKSALVAALAHEWRASGGTVTEITMTPTVSLLRSVHDAAMDVAVARGISVTDEASGGQGRADPEHEDMLSDTTSCLSALSENAPLLLIVEDTQHCDASDARHLTHLLEQSTGTRAFTIATQRTGQHREAVDDPDARPLAALLDRRDAHGMRVEHLTDQQILRLAEREAHVGSLEMELAARVAEMAAGLPLFAIEAMRHLLSSGQVEILQGVARCSASWDPRAIPVRLQDVIDARLMALDLPNRALLETACVDGRRFDGRAVAAVSGEPLVQVLRELQVLARESGIVRATEGGFEFAHGLLQERMYELLAPELRTALHGMLATHLESRLEERVPPHAERVGSHWLSAGDDKRAQPYLIQAARDAGRRQEMLRAVRLAEHAGMLATQVPSEFILRESHEFLKLTALLREVGRWPDADRILCRAEAVAEEAQDTGLTARLLIWRSWFSILTGGAAALDEPALAAATGPASEYVEGGVALYLLGCAAKHREDFDAARDYLQDALVCFAAPGNAFWKPHALHELGSVELTMGRIEPAVGAYRSAADAAAQHGARANQVISTVVADIAAFQAGAMTDLAASLGNAVHVLTLSGAKDQAEYVRVHQAQVVLAEGRVKEAEALIEQSRSALEKGQLVFGLIAALSEDAFLRLCCGDLAGALAGAEKAEEHSRASAYISGEVEARLLRAECLARMGCDREARPLLDEVLRRAAAGKDEILKAMTGQRCAIILAATNSDAIPRDALRLLAAQMDGRATLTSETQRLITAVLALGGGCTPDALARVAQALAAVRAGPRRAHRLLLGRLFDARGVAATPGREQELEPLAEDGAKRAAELRDVWLQFEFLVLVDRCDPAWSTLKEREALVGSVTLPESHATQAGWLSSQWGQRIDGRPT